MEATLQFDSKTNQPIVTPAYTFPLRDPSASDELRLPKDQLPKGIQIQPKEGFSYKTKRVEDGGKVFINIVTHEKLQKPSTKKKLDAEGNEVEGLNIPMSVGAAHLEVDKKGTMCTAYDIVVHPDVLVDMEADMTGKFREFLCQLGIQCLEQKYKEQLDKRYKLPKLAYFGEKVPTQTIQDREKMPKIEEIIEKSSKPKSAPKEQAPIVQRVLKDLPTKSFWCKLAHDKEEPLILDAVFNGEVKSIFAEPDQSHVSTVFQLADCNITSTGEYVEPLHRPPTSDTQAILVEADFQAYDTALLKPGATKSSSSATADLLPLAVDIAPYTVKVAVPGYKPVTVYLGIGIVPPRSYYHLVKLTGTVSLYRLILVLPIDKRSFQDVVDPGSKPWLVLQALRDDDKSASSPLDAEVEAWEASASSNTSTSLSEQRYPGSRIVDIGRVDEDTELPEDAFHRKDAASSWIISQREQSRVDKAKKYEEERKVLANDPNVEFVDMHKPQNSGVDYEGGSAGGRSTTGQSSVYRAAAEVTASYLKSNILGASSSSSTASAAAVEQPSTISATAQQALKSLQANMWTELLD